MWKEHLQEWMECGICKHSHYKFYIACNQGHSFCGSCIKRLVSSCPICRMDLIKEKIEDLSRKNLISLLYNDFFTHLQHNFIEIDALDCDFQWYDAKVLDWNGECFLVHFYGWGEKWDEWIQCDPERIAPYRTYTTEWISSIYKGQQIEFKIFNDKKNPLWYIGKIEYIDPRRKFLYVYWKSKKCSIKISIDKDFLSPVGVHSFFRRK